MRWRGSHVWTLAGAVAFAVLLAFAWCPVATLDAAAGMSAPAAPSAAIETARAANLLQTQFDWHGGVLAPAALWLVPIAMAGHAPAQTAGEITAPRYAPLWQRPPPHFS